MPHDACDRLTRRSKWRSACVQKVKVEVKVGGVMESCKEVWQGCQGCACACVHSCQRQQASDCAFLQRISHRSDPRQTEGMDFCSIPHLFRHPGPVFCTLPASGLGYGISGVCKRRCCRMPRWGSLLPTQAHSPDIPDSMETTVRWETACRLMYQCMSFLSWMCGMHAGLGAT